MATQASAHPDRKYDRDFLLSPEKRNQVVELWEVEKYGRDCFADADHVHLYGMKPREWHERGVRILARTCLEAVKDPLGNKIGADIAQLVARASGNRAIGVVDPFAGSCNGLYAILRHLPGGNGIGFEIEPAVFDLTTRNILHLDRTKPPVLEIVRDFEQVYGSQPVLYVTEVHEVNDPTALKAVEAAFDWTGLRIYDVNVPGLQHGILLGTRRWPRGPIHKVASLSGISTVA